MALLLGKSMKIRYDIIAFWSAVGLAVLFACLIAVWTPFAIFAGFFMSVASTIFTYWAYSRYHDYERKIDEQKFEDAYVYADENNTNFDPEHYSYGRKAERKISSTHKSLRSTVFVGGVLCVASVVIIVLGILMVLG